MPHIDSLGTIIEAAQLYCDEGGWPNLSAALGRFGNMEPCRALSLLRTGEHPDGTPYVQVGAVRLNPRQARSLAAEIIRLADEVEDREDES